MSFLQIEKKQKPPNFKHIRYNHKNTVANSHDHGRKKTSDENDNTNDVVFARSASAGGYSTNLKNDNDFHTINHNNNDADVEKEDWISVHPLVLRSRGVYLGGPFGPDKFMLIHAHTDTRHTYVLSPRAHIHIL